ncbi:MAG: hypothetical protein JO182_32275 [Acidobacteriaceae bacterium]|nr:hypothetical protein [Acidobacteriaceae bacterium]
MAGTLRIDVALEIGSAAESVTVTEAAALLKTESGELSHNVTGQALDDLPVLAIGAAAGSSSVRNPTTVAELVPGTFVNANVNLKVNGGGCKTFCVSVVLVQNKENNVWRQPSAKKRSNRSGWTSC